MDKNTIPPPPSTYNGTALTLPPAAMLGCGFPRGPDDKQNGLCSNNIVNGSASIQPEELSNLLYTSDNGYWYQNNLAAVWQPNETNLHEPSGNAIYTPSVGQLATENSLTEGQTQDFSRHEQSGHLISNLNASGIIPNLSSILPLLVEKLQNRSLDPRMFCINVEGQACCSNIQALIGDSRGSDSSKISTAVNQYPEVHVEHVNDIFLQNQPQISSACSSFSTNNFVQGDTEIQTTFSSAASSLIQPKKETTSSKKIETDPSICINALKTEEQTISSTSDEMVACKAREKLWNGTLQLSSSVQSSVAAYFRSGSKMPEIYWTDSIEVKGKVRLGAFEKYIQDLPRSRSRGLMVMALCLKEGSSKGRLKAVNEAIQKYETEKKVGRAQLSPGADVYICPNTKAIITILAKNGFSKDSLSIQDHQDSLIGCAVWRKDISSNPQQQVDGSDSSSAKAEVEAIQRASTEAPGNNSGESKNPESSNDVHAINNIVKKLTEIEASIFKSLGIEKHQGNLQLLRTILPSSSDVAVKQPDLPTEDDDLPEYDFTSAVPHASTTPNSLDSVAIEPCQIRIESQKDVYGGALLQKRKITDLSTQEQANMLGAQSTYNNNKLVSSKTRNLFDEDDMPEWKPPDMKHFKPSTDTRPPFVPNTCRPPLPPQPPLRPPQFRPAVRPQHGDYSTNKPANDNSRSRH